MEGAYSDIDFKIEGITTSASRDLTKSRLSFRNHSRAIQTPPYMQSLKVALGRTRPGFRQSLDDASLFYNLLS